MYETIDETRVENNAGGITTWTLIFEDGEYIVIGEAVGMLTKERPVGTDKEKARGIFNRLFKQTPKGERG